HGDVLMWLMKTLLTSGCTNQRGAGQMASHVFNLLMKIALLAVVMMIVARVVPYDGLVDSITGSFTYQRALLNKSDFG
ncbi:hypothetical protein ACJEQE_31395, partial [Klebsiella pneumoniae]